MPHRPCTLGFVGLPSAPWKEVQVAWPLRYVLHAMRLSRALNRATHCHACIRTALSARAAISCQPCRVEPHPFDVITAACTALIMDHLWTRYAVGHSPSWSALHRTAQTSSQMHIHTDILLQHAGSPNPNTARAHMSFELYIATKPAVHKLVDTTWMNRSLLHAA